MAHVYIPIKLILRYVTPGSKDLHISTLVDKYYQITICDRFTSLPLLSSFVSIICSFNKYEAPDMLLVLFQSKGQKN